MIDSAAIPRIPGDMDALAAHAGEISEFGTAFADTGARVNASWQGLAAVYEAPETGQLLAATGPVQQVSAAVGEDHRLVGRALSGYAAEVREIQARLNVLRAQAVAFEAPMAGDRADDDAGDELQRAVNQAVADFQEAERRCANAINALYDGPRYRAHDGDGRREPGEYGYPAQLAPGSQPLGVDPAILAFLLAAVAGMLARASTLPSPPAGGTPEQNAAWWASLTAGMQQVLLVAGPGVLGNLAGLPAWARDRANRSRLHGEASRLDAEIARLRAELTPHRSAPGFESAYYRELRRLEQLQAKRASIEAIESTLSKPGERQLLLLDLSGDRAEAAVAIGNVDTAEHVAVFTPGFTTTVDGSLAGYDEQMRQLRREAEWQAYQQGYEVEVATVTWIGYQAPQWAGVFSPSESVLSRTAAEHGAEDLAEFYRGVNAARTDDPHLTAIGHSYGSTTTGLAVQQPDTGVDDVVFLGSPGIGTSDIEELHVSEGHTYVVEASGDPIADVAHFGADPNHLDGVTGLSAREEAVDGRDLVESTGHLSGDANGYLANGTTSQYNISVVVAGMPERAVHDRGIGVGDWLW